MSKRVEIKINKQPDLITTTPTESTYKGLSQSELLYKVKLLHEQILKINKYLLEVHRLSIYNWDINDTGNIIVELPSDQKGFLLDSILRLRGSWDPHTNVPELLETDPQRAGWIYKVSTSVPVLQYEIGWKDGDYALYDEDGVLHNVTADMMSTLFTPIIPIESNTIQFDALQQTADGIQIRANVKVDPSDTNDITSSAKGLFSDAYQRAKSLITIQEVAPTSDNLSGGLKIVYLNELPPTMYDGWLYLVPPSITTLEQLKTIGRFIISNTDAISPATYSQVTAMVQGISNPYLYSSDVASWNNKLDVEITSHADINAAQKIISSGLKYTTFDILLTPNSSGLIACVDQEGAHTSLRITAGEEIELVTTPNNNIKFYYNGSETNTLSPNVWYKVRIDYSNFVNVYTSGHTCIELSYTLGDIYLNDVRYYMDEEGIDLVAHARTIEGSNEVSSSASAVFEVFGATDAELVTSFDQLQAGDTIIITNSTATHAMGEAQDVSNRKAFATNNSNPIATLLTDLSEEDIEDIVLVPHPTDPTQFALQVDEGYLYASSNSTNALKSQTNITYWSISFNNTNAILTSLSGVSRNILRYNSTNSLFSCYTSGQQDVKIFKFIKP